MDRRDLDAKIYCPVCRKRVLSRLVVEHLMGAEHQALSPWTPPPDEPTEFATPGDRTENANP